MSPHDTGEMKEFICYGEKKKMSGVNGSIGSNYTLSFIIFEGQVTLKQTAVEDYT